MSKREEERYNEILNYSLNNMDDNTKFCTVCGMPLVTANDYPMDADMKTVDWCKYCGDKEGMKNYSELVKGMTEYIKGEQNISEEEATVKAEEAIKGSVAYTSGRLK